MRRRVKFLGLERMAPDMFHGSFHGKSVWATLIAGMWRLYVEGVWVWTWERNEPPRKAPEWMRHVLDYETAGTVFRVSEAV